jgi:Na+/proline symporter
MVNTGALFTRNVYRDYFRADATDRQLLRIGRLSGLALTLLGILFALCVEEVLQAFLFTETISALMGIMFLGGFLWKRANRYGAFAATLAAFLVYYGLNFLASRELLLVYRWTAAPFAWALLAGSVAFVAISLVTKREDPQRIARFFDAMNRSSDAEPTPGSEARALAADSGQDLLLVDLPGWFNRERWRKFFFRYREDLAGFVLAWATVGLLILVAWAVMQIGR